jgi:two-component system, CAI-1 autoinducer sensor kinase/phosphatase CqsS
MSLWDRLGLHNARTHLGRWLLDEIVHAPLEPILHASRMRLWWAGFCTIAGNLVFYWIWHGVWPQPFESLWARVFVAALGLFLFLPCIPKDIGTRCSTLIFSVVCWTSLPAFFFWMYWMNGGNPTWLASISAMFLIYYHLTDWRIATLGCAAGALVGWAAWYVHASDVTASLPAQNTVILLFAWGVAFLLGVSSANLRRVRLINALSTMGVMAHELRTPLATMNLMGDVLRTMATNDLPQAQRRRVEDFAERLQKLVRSMNLQIDTQISNAQLLRLPKGHEHIMAAELVQEVIHDFPYRSSRERDCVSVHIRQNFGFLGSRPLFAQVLVNLLKNALHSLASASRTPTHGDIRLEVGLHLGKGRIAVSDEGVGIAHAQQRRIFEPFYSTQSGAGSGLGLTFCKNVVEAADGTLSVQSEPDSGAVFMIDLPLK